MASLFTELRNEASKAGVKKRAQQSIEWFKNRLRAMTTVNRRQILNDERLSQDTTIRVGTMVMFFYDAKGKDTLPYFDRFPLVILIDKKPDGFTGLNLHYLDPISRAKFLDVLLEYAVDKRMSDTTRLQLTYSTLAGVSRLNMFAPCFKKYLDSQVRSSITKVPMSEWPIASFLPTDSFAGANRERVWKESKKLYA